jgi:tetratricopeptide (TPR) repeat protein/CheY-like chemotaxis protein
VRLRVPLFALALVLGAAGLATAQEAPKKPIDVFRAARDYLQAGSLELAAETFKDFLNLKPTDQDYLDVEAKYGANAFQNLRNVPRWLPDAKKDAEFKKTVIEGIIEGSLKANEKLTRNPARLLRLVQNLGESREERDFAIAELNRAGDAVVPVLVENLRVNTSPEYRAGALTAVTRLNAEVVPGLVVATENVPEELKVGLIKSLAGRSDVTALTGKADTNFMPYLWYLAASDQAGGLRDTAIQTLRDLTGDRSDRLQADVELVKYATPMYERKGSFAAYDRVKNRVKLWVWDAAARNVKPVELTPTQAEEQTGLKYLKWAIERRPGSEPAQELFLSLATERAVERASFGDLAKADPNVSQLLASAPAGMLINLLDSALAENKTALAYGLTQALGNRAETAAAIPRKVEGGGEKKPAPLVKALNYSDPRVQLAAAAALLKMPQVEHGANARIVDVLKRAAGGDGAAGGMGKALIADPLAARGDQVATMLRGVGYQSEVFGTGRELFKRINRSSDFDLILVDRHVVEPTLQDVLAQLAANTNAGRRPILVVASPDNVVAPSVETQLLRLAVLVAVTETTEMVVPPPYEVDRRKTREENEDLRKLNVRDRDDRLMRIYEGRLARMRRIVTAANLGTSIALETRLGLRLPQLALAALLAEYQPTAEFAPTPFRDLRNYTQLLRRQPELDKALEGAPTADLIRLIAQLETALTPEMRKTFDAVLMRIDADALNLPRTPSIDPVTEAVLKRAVSGYKGVSVIAEPFAVGSVEGSVRYGLAYDVQAAVADPAQRPRDATERNASTKLALDWLRRLAVGEQTGFDLTPAVPALRQALSNDEYAEIAIEALSRIPVAGAQQDLARVAATTARAAAVRGKAADAAVRHVQANGKMTNAEVDQLVATALAGEANPELKSKLAVLSAALTGKPGDLVNRIKGYTVPTAAPTPPKAATPPVPNEAKPPVENKQ